MLPATAVVDVTRLLMGMAFSSLDNNRQLKEKALETHLARLRIEADTSLEERRIDARIHEVNAQKELYLALVQTAQHVFNRKMDFFVEGFQRVLALLAQQQQALLEERTALQGKEFVRGLSDEAFIHIQKSRQALTDELRELNISMATMRAEYNTWVKGLAPEVRLSLPSF